MDVDYASSHTLLRRRVRAGSLWFGILCGPLAAFADEQFEYFMVSWSCGHFGAVTRVMLHVVPISLIALCVVAGLVSWNAHTHPIDASDDRSADADRSRRGFMALLGVGLSIMGLLVILAQWIPVWYLSPCVFL